MIFIAHLEISPIITEEIEFLEYIAKFGEVYVIPIESDEKEILPLEERIEYFNDIKFKGNISLYLDHYAYIESQNWRVDKYTISYAEILDYFLSMKNLTKKDVMLVMPEYQYDLLPSTAKRKADLYEYSYFRISSYYLSTKQLTVKHTISDCLQLSLNKMFDSFKSKLKLTTIPSEIINKITEKYGKLH